MTIEAVALPAGALLAKYSRGGSYTDCYVTDIARAVTHAEYVEAFYTGAAFKLERLLLAWFVSRPSTDGQAKQLAAGALSRFAAWDVEARTADELLMCDLSGRTRSWLMVAPLATGGAPATRLYFGSAVVPAHDRASGRKRVGLLFRSLLGFHRIYSRVLLHGARSRLLRVRSFA